MKFFRFPRTPHLAWLGPTSPRDDKVLTPDESRELLAHDVAVEEKVDGANIGLSVDERGGLRAQNRGAFLSHDSGHPQFKSLFRWLDARRDSLIEALHPNLILFGEWCTAVHGIRYTRLPDWFLGFDVYDRRLERFWSVSRRDDLARLVDVVTVPSIAVGRFKLVQLKSMFGQSKFGDGPAEGLYIRQDEGDHLVARAKLIRPEFAQSIETHWSKRRLERNRLAEGVAWR